MRGILILSIDETKRIVKITNPLTLSWEYEYIGNMTSYLAKVPSIRGTKVYYNVSGYYFFLETFNEISNLIVKMMEIYEIDVRNYNIVKMMSREYFIFECYPEEETIFKKRIFNEKEKTITIFHWLLGIKGRILIRRIGGQIETYSCGPYVLDYEKTDFTDCEIRELFESKSEMRKYGEFFTKNVENTRQLLAKHYNWFLKINDRMKILN